MIKKKILVVGIDDFNRHELSQIKDVNRYEFLTVLDPHVIQSQDKIDVQQITYKIKEVFDKHENSIDGIITFYDFPFTLITFQLAEEYNLTGPSLLSGLKCEHKYWSRLEQKELVPENVPTFDAINPFDPKEIKEIIVDTPFWLKPVKTHSSQLGFKIKDEAGYKKAIDELQKEIKHFAEPFNYILNQSHLPDEIKDVDGHHCIVEDILKGHQCTLSGYVYNNEVYTYGIVDSLFYDEAPSFLCYLLPSQLPKEVQQKLGDISTRLMKHIGFNNSPFNIEFFYNEEENKIKILEINPRMSQSHGYIYNMVKGHSNHQVLVKLALNEKPDFANDRGKYPFAAKFQYRVFDDGIVKEVPSGQQVSTLEKQFQDTSIQMNIREGDVLSELKINDTYSYCIGEILLSGESKEQLFEKYTEIKNKLNVRIEKA